MIIAKRFLWVAYQAAGKASQQKGAFIIGFDRRHERYSLIAMDTDGTYSICSHGKKDPKSGKIRMHGTDDDPHMKALGIRKAFVQVSDFSDPDHFVIEVYFVDPRTPAPPRNGKRRLSNTPFGG